MVKKIEGARTVELQGGCHAAGLRLRLFQKFLSLIHIYPVREPQHRQAGADEVMKLPGAVLGRGVVINVIMNVD